MKFTKYMNESSLSRLYQHMTEHDTGTITAFRAEEHHPNETMNKKVVKTYTRKENQERNRKLFARLQQRYHVTSVKGAYIENYGTKFAKEVGEEVYFVVDWADTGNLEKDLRKWGTEFNQDSVLFIPKGGKAGYLIGTKKDEFSNYYAYPHYGQKVKLANAVWDSEGEFMTKIKGRPFIFNESTVTECIVRGRSQKLGLSLLAKEPV